MAVREVGGSRITVCGMISGIWTLINLIGKALAASGFEQFLIDIILLSNALFQRR